MIGNYICIRDKRKYYGKPDKVEESYYEVISEEPPGYYKLSELYYHDYQRKWTTEYGRNIIINKELIKEEDIVPGWIIMAEIL